MIAAGRLVRMFVAVAALALSSCGGGRPILASARVTYECPSCGKARTLDVGAPAPECCGTTLRR